MTEERTNYRLTQRLWRARREVWCWRLVAAALVLALIASAGCHPHEAGHCVTKSGDCMKCWGGL